MVSPWWSLALVAVALGGIAAGWGAVVLRREAHRLGAPSRSTTSGPPSPPGGYR